MTRNTAFYAAAALAGTLAGAGLVQAFAKPPAAKPAATKQSSYRLPEETATLRPGPNRDVAEANCTGCHSVDYIATQPKGAKFKADFWKAEVTKMVKVYGAPIEETDVPKIVEYLTAAYADDQPAAAPAATSPGPDGRPAQKPASASR